MADDWQAMSSDFRAITCTCGGMWPKWSVHKRLIFCFALDVHALGVHALVIHALGVRAIGIHALGVHALDIHALGIHALGVHAIATIYLPYVVYACHWCHMPKYLW